MAYVNRFLFGWLFANPPSGFTEDMWCPECSNLFNAYDHFNIHKERPLQGTSKHVLVRLSIALPSLSPVSPSSPGTPPWLLCQSVRLSLSIPTDCLTLLEVIHPSSLVCPLICRHSFIRLGPFPIFGSLDWLVWLVCCFLQAGYIH